MIRKSWTDEMIEIEIRKCMEALSIDRMPTAYELRETLKRNDLHCQICRTKKFSGWAEFLGLERKESHTLDGQAYESLILSKLKELGHSVKRMTTKFPYDILINGTVKADVKVGRAYMLRGSRVHSFGINKKEQTCDLYIILALSENDEIERIFVIPSHLLKLTTLCIGSDSKYNRFLNRWDYIDHYTKFFRLIV